MEKLPNLFQNTKVLLLFFSYLNLSPVVLLRVTWLIFVKSCNLRLSGP